MATQYVNALAVTVSELFAEGINDPSVEEIIKRYYKGIPVLPSKGSLMTAHQIRSVRSILAEDGHQTCPLSPTYYRRFRHRLAKTQADAMRCLPVGSGNATVGMRRLVGSADEDIIWLTWQKVRETRSVAEYAKVRDETSSAVTAGRITFEQAELVFETSRQLLESALPEILNRVTAPELPAGK